MCMSRSDFFALPFRFMSFSSSFSLSLFEELPQSYDAANSACSAIDRLQQKFPFSSSFSLETLFPSAKIIHHESGINRIISRLRSWKIAKSFVLLYQTKLFTAAQG